MKKINRIDEASSLTAAKSAAKFPDKLTPHVRDQADAKCAAILTRSHDAGMGALPVIFDAGLYAYWIKANLPPQQFGAWLKANADQRLWKLNKKGCPKPSSTLSWQMSFTLKLIDAAKSTVEKVLAQIPNDWEFGETGKFLQLSQGIPKALLALHTECIKKIEGKTATQLFLEFKQTEEGEDGEDHVKRGRLAGEGGRPPTDHINLELRKKFVLKTIGQAMKQLDKVGPDFILLEDKFCELMLSELERRTKCINAWLRQPVNARDIAAIQDLWKNS